jgi:hypothetical protein
MATSPLKKPQSTIERVHTNIAKYRLLAATSAAFHEFPLAGGRILIVTPTRVHAMEEATYDELFFVPSHRQPKSSMNSTPSPTCRTPTLLASVTNSHATTPSWPKSDSPTSFVMSDHITLHRGPTDGGVATLAVCDIISIRCTGTDVEINMVHTSTLDTRQLHSRLPTAAQKPLFGGCFRARLVNPGDASTIAQLMAVYRAPFQQECREVSALERAATFVENWDSALPQRPRAQYLGSDIGAASPAPSTFVGDCVQIANACQPLEL